MGQALSVLAKAKSEMSCGHRASPKFQLLRRILDKARRRYEVEERAGSLLEQLLLWEYVSFLRPEGFSHDGLWSTYLFETSLLGITASPMIVVGDVP